MERACVEHVQQITIVICNKIFQQGSSGNVNAPLSSIIIIT